MAVDKKGPLLAELVGRVYELNCGHFWWFMEAHMPNGVVIGLAGGMAANETEAKAMADGYETVCKRHAVALISLAATGQPPIVG